MKLGTHMHDGERRKPTNIEVCRSQLLKIEQKFDTFFFRTISHAERNKSHELEVCRSRSQFLNIEP